MKYVDRKTYGQEDLEKLVKKIPFFREISASNQEQFNLLLDVSKIAQAETNEELIKQGSRDDYLYFLLKGMLDVKASNTAGEDTVINSIHTGEVFGALAMLMNSERTATIVASSGSKEVIVLALPYSLFEGTDEFEQFTLPTKLNFYRMLTNNIRWTIEMKKSVSPNSALVNDVRKLPLYLGEKDGIDELKALKEQATASAELLFKWNEIVE